MAEKLTSEQIEEIKRRLQQLGETLPTDGEEALRKMVSYRNIHQVFGWLSGPAIDYSKRNAECYNLAREMALHYEADVSNLPTRLGVNTGRFVGVVLKDW